MSKPTAPVTPRLVHIDGVAYDVEAWAKKHPGGEVMLRFLGRDATAAFVAFHGRKTRRTLKPFRAKGDVGAPPPVELAQPVERDFDALRLAAEQRGQFVGRHAFFAARLAVILGLIAGCVASVVWLPVLWPLAALALGLAWQQAGWLSHDLLHHSVHPDTRRRGDRQGILLGSIVLGFSADWWKRKHNTHHAMPNVIGTDPDIDVLPLLAFDDRQAAAAGPLGRFFVRIQSFTLWPIVAFARLNWVAQSILWAAFAPRVRYRRMELFALFAHVAWNVALLWALPDWPTRIGFFFVSQLSSGLMTGAVFMVGHNARPMFADDSAAGFYAQQVQTTQNVRVTALNRWFFGGLERQIEHHLFPTMPRHFHDAVRAEVQALCARHGLVYTERGFFQGLADVQRVVNRVSRDLRRGLMSEQHPA
jgi:fatty acid desaturase